MHLDSDTVLVTQATLTPANPFVITAFSASVSNLKLPLFACLSSIHNYILCSYYLYPSSIDWYNIGHAYMHACTEDYIDVYWYVCVAFMLCMCVQQEF